MCVCQMGTVVGILISCGSEVPLVPCRTTDDADFNWCANSSPGWEEAVQQLSDAQVGSANIKLWVNNFI